MSVDAPPQGAVPQVLRVGRETREFKTRLARLPRAEQKLGELAAYRDLFRMGIQVLRKMLASGILVPRLQMGSGEAEIIGRAARIGSQTALIEADGAHGLSGGHRGLTAPPQRLAGVRLR